MPKHEPIPILDGKTQTYHCQVCGEPLDEGQHLVNHYRDGVCHAYIGKTDRPCGLDARHYHVERRDVLSHKTRFDGTLDVWFCEYHRKQAKKAGWQLTPFSS